MEILILASGSKGNATLIKTKDNFILIDVGISYQRIKTKLAANNIDINLIDTILLTHEHIDHVIGLKQFLKNHALCNVFLTEGTYRALRKDFNRQDTVSIIKADQPFFLNDTKINPLMIFHDANEPIGFLITEAESKMVYLTDTGYIHRSYYDLLTDLDLYVLEANHDPHMLLNSDRPFQLKRRIIGDKGHLSNEDAVYFLNKVIINKTATFIASHISEECNSLAAITQTITAYFKNPHLLKVYFATQEGLKVFKI